MSAIIPRTEKAVTLANPQQIARRAAADARLELQEAVSQFAEYVDPAGERATSPGGFMRSINGRLAKAFGQKADEIVEPSLMDLVSAVCRALATVIRMGMAETKLRKTIKQEVSQEIARWGKFVRREAV